MRAFSILSIACVGAGLLVTSPAAGEMNHPSIARWHDNKSAAISMRFDDAHESHVEYVIPRLNEIGWKATFMVNPGLDRYLKYKSFWETEVPRMRHDLGNHTMHHRGARTPEDADYEIGEVTRIIRRAYPDRGRLMVFASGGRASWGGKSWEKADPEYKKLVEKYDLIDLYDGNHPALGVDTRYKNQDVLKRIVEAIQKGEHLSINFHGIGTAGLIDRMKVLVRGYDLFLPRTSFESLLSLIMEKKERIWVAPVLDILKYEAERDGASLKVRSGDRKRILLELTVKTDPDLYDGLLTLIIPVPEGEKVASIVQGDASLVAHGSADGSILVDVKPVNGPIAVNFHPSKGNAR